MKQLILPLLFILSACAGKQEISTETTYGSAGQPYTVKTTQLMTENMWGAQQRTTADVAIANATSECWKAQTESNVQIPLGLTGTDLAMTVMANALLESNRAMAKMNSKSDPCSNMGTNSNDVLIARENGRTIRNQSMHSTLGKVAGFVVGGYAVGKVVDGFSGLAIDALRANSAVSRDAIANSGDRVTTTINGDNNRSNTTTQNADNGSVISDSGNYTEAGGIPLNQADVEPIALGATPETPTDPTDEVEDFPEVIDQATCEIRPNATWREANEEEVLAGLDIDGFVCSDGEGGLL